MVIGFVVSLTKELVHDTSGAWGVGLAKVFEFTRSLLDWVVCGKLPLPS